MSRETPGYECLVQRLKQLERRYRRLRLAGALTLLLVGAAFLTGLSLPKNRVVEAEEIILVDQDRRQRIWLGVVEGRGPLAVFRDQDGKDRFQIEMNGLGQVGLRFMDREGNYLFKKTF